jgi:MFS family permease
MAKTYKHILFRFFTMQPQPKKPQIDPAQEEKKRKRSLTFSIYDGAFYSLMDGFTGIFITPLALFLKSSNLIISLLASLPDLISSFFQLLAIKISEIVTSRKKVIVIAAFVQAILWLPILLIPYLAKEGYGGWYLLLFMIIIATAGAFINPLWRSLMGDLVDEHERGKYFSRRNQIAGLVSFLAAFLAGYILNHFSKTNAVIGFTILFAVAIFARTCSAILLMSMHEPALEKKKKDDGEPLLFFLKNLSKNNYGKFVLFIFFLNIGTAIASPFFAVYMLKTLHIDYWKFTILNAVSLLANLLFLSIWGRFNDEQGSKRVMLITGFIVPLIPFLFILSSSFEYLLFVQALSGMAWGGFNLAVGNFIFDATTPEKRTRYVAYYNLLNGVGNFLGATIGGILLGIIAIRTVFVISTVARFTVVLFLLPTLREMRLVEVNLGKSLFRPTLHIRPHGMPFQSIDAYKPHPKQIETTKPPKKKPPKPPQINLKEKEFLWKKFVEHMLENAKKK